MLFGLIFTLPTIPDRKSGQASTFPLLSSSGHEVASEFTWKFTNPSFRQTSLVSGRQSYYILIWSCWKHSQTCERWGVGSRVLDVGCDFRGKGKFSSFSLSLPSTPTIPCTKYFIVTGNSEILHIVTGNSEILHIEFLVLNFAVC